MNTKKIIVLSGLMLFFLSLSSFKIQSDFSANLISVEDQEGLIVYATFDGKEDYGYNFITKDRDGEEQTLTFQKVEDAVLASFDLNGDTLIGTKFKITFNRDLKFSKDEDGMDDEDETNTIIKLEKL
ncbi:hypothetical protein [uncultured Algibacter sp.]|uniref:hypothetical protein n=1 Tax=uncultured Algibacter sp. TaxID=298659 RepID=UPI00260A2DC5|nr:hypothetical protein [uncultured Algibacter sp.]